MAGKTAVPKLTKSDAVYAAEKSGQPMIVYYVRGGYHLIHSSFEHHISVEATIIHRTQKDEPRIFKYDEGGRRVREETVNERGVVTSVRYIRKPKGKMEVGASRTGYAAKRYHR